MNALTPRPPDGDLKTRVSVLEEKVHMQQQEMVSLRPHFDNSLAQMELRNRDELHTTVHGAEQRLMEQLTKRQDEHFRWLFGMLIVIFLSNSATILTVMNLLQDR
jgi:membrane carboxypeptidase/penicillin-binding protein PbpC